MAKSLHLGRNHLGDAGILSDGSRGVHYVFVTSDPKNDGTENLLTHKHDEKEATKR